MKHPSSTPNPVAQSDAGSVIAIIATLQGALYAGDLDSRTKKRLSERLLELGVMAAPNSDTALYRALEGLNHRMRYALGEIDSLPTHFDSPDLPT